MQREAFFVELSVADKVRHFRHFKVVLVGDGFNRKKRKIVGHGSPGHRGAFHVDRVRAIGFGELLLLSST